MALAALTVKIGADISDLNRGLTDAQQNDQTFGAGVTRNATAPIARLTAETTKAHLGTGRLTRELSTLTREALGLNPALTHISESLGEMALGGGMMLAVVGGIAAIAYGWDKLTEGAREARKATDEAIKSLEALRDKQRLGSIAGTSAREAEKAGTELFFVQEEILKVRTRLQAQRAVGGGQETQKELTALEERQAELRSLIAAHETEVTRVRKEAAEKRDHDTKEAADKEWTTWQRMLGNKVTAMQNTEDTLTRLLKDGAESRARNADLNKLGLGTSTTGSASGPIAGFQFTPAMFAQLTTIGGSAAATVALAARVAQVLEGITKSEAQKASLKGTLINGGLGLLSQFGGGDSKGLLASIIGGGISGSGGGLLGVIAGASFPILGALFGKHAKAVDRNTDALHRLAEVMGAPAGFKVDAYRYRAAKAVEYDMSQRGGTTFHGLAFGG